MCSLLLICFVLWISNSVAVQKEWIHTTLYTDINNWSPPRLPCPSGKTLLKDGTVFVTNGTLPAEIVMSANVEIVFASNSEILLGPPLRTLRNEPACGQSEFLPSKKYWHNPLNWKDTENEIVPFVERVPCSQDDVIFPKHNSFITTISRSVEVKSVTLRGKNIEDDAILKSFLSKDDFKENFEYSNQAALTISGKQCPQQGCVCDVYKNKESRSLVCNSFKCPTVTCENKVKARQDCCFSCGGLLEFEYDDSKFDLSACKAFLNYSAYVSRVTDNLIQIFVADKTDDLVTDTKLDSIYQAIQQSGSPCSGKIGSIKKKTSADFLSDVQETKKRTIILAILLPILATIVLVILIMAYVRYRRNRLTKKHDEFKNPENINEYPGVEIVDTQTTDFIDTYDSDVEGAGKNSDGVNGFQNPVFEWDNSTDHEIEAVGSTDQPDDSQKSVSQDEIRSLDNVLYQVVDRNEASQKENKAKQEDDAKE